MIIRYTDLYDTLEIRLPQFNYFRTFERCRWYDVEDRIGQELLKSDYFVRKEDLDFEKTLLKTGLERIALSRWGALGDLILLAPLAKAFKKKFNVSLTLVTQKCYIEFMSYFIDIFDAVIPPGALDKNYFKKVLYLDGVLECDHSLTNPEREIHRCQLYADTLQVDCKDLDWSIKIPEAIQEETRKLLCL